MLYSAWGYRSPNSGSWQKPVMVKPLIAIGVSDRDMGTPRQKEDLGITQAPCALHILGDIARKVVIREGR